MRPEGQRRQIYLHPFLLSAYAVLFVYAANMRYALFGDVLFVTALAVGLSVVIFAVCAAIFRNAARGALVAGAIVIVLFGYRYITAALGPSGSSLVFFAIAVAIVGGAVLLVVRWPRYVPAVNTGLTVVSIVLLGFTLTKVVPNIVVPPRTSLVGDTTASGLSATSSTDRDIFYLVLDRYGSATALADGFGITDNNMPEWLRSQGFYVADAARANYIRTLLSQPATLNLEYLDPLVQAMGADSSDYRPLVDAFQRHRAALFLKEQGYRYIHMGNWFGPTSTISVADENLRGSQWSEFDSTLYDSSAFSAFTGLFQPAGQVPRLDDVSADDALYQFNKLHELAKDPSKDFVFAHILLPHDPYVFDRDGNRVSASAEETLSRDDLFRGQLAYTNAQIQDLVEDLLEGPDESDPIVVIQSDEGPYPAAYDDNQYTFDWTKATDSEVQTKYGVLDAFFLPDEDDDHEDVAPYDSISTVNTWRLIFSRYFGADLPLLPDRSFVSMNPDRPYDLMDVTDRLPAASGQVAP